MITHHPLCELVVTALTCCPTLGCFRHVKPQLVSVGYLFEFTIELC